MYLRGFLSENCMAGQVCCQWATQVLNTKASQTPQCPGNRGWLTALYWAFLSSQGGTLQYLFIYQDVKVERPFRPNLMSPRLAYSSPDLLRPHVPGRHSAIWTVNLISGPWASLKGVISEVCIIEWLWKQDWHSVICRKQVIRLL